MKTITQLIPILDKDTNEILYYTDENTGINYAPMNETTLHLIDGYELVDENGNVINAKKVTLTKKQPQYPKTYEECCEVLFPHSIELGKVLTSGYNCELLKKLGELLICRDAYLKIAGDWKPDWTDDTKEKCMIFTSRNDIEIASAYSENYILAFPTEQMRDTFFNNFYDLIESCKELL